MTSRRKFIIQGSLAAGAMLALKQVKALGNLGSPFYGTGLRDNKLFFIHTAGIPAEHSDPIARYITRIQDKHPGTIVLRTSEAEAVNQDGYRFDAQICNSHTPEATPGNYQVLTRGNIRTGLISVHPGKHGIIRQVNELAGFLRKEKKCSFVVCLSQLGYKQARGLDDLTLAAQTCQVDFILGGHKDNFTTHPVVALNQFDREVIIQSSTPGPDKLGTIEIDLDENGNKKFVRFP